MNTKTLFSVRLSANNTTHEFWVPNELSILKVTQLICRILKEQEGRFFTPNTSTTLYLESSGDELDINLFVEEYGFANGTRLVLI
jgi:hypothetical protein